MKFHNLIGAKRRKRRAHDERRLGTARGERGNVRSLEQSLDLLHQPHVDQGTRGAAVGDLQRAVGNAQVARMLAQRETETMVRRYPVDVAEDASCDEVIQWIDANSPYAPEWAHTEGNPRWTGGFRITGDAERGFRLRVSNPRVTLDGGPHVDMPQWRPSDPAMRRAWRRAYRTLRAHEARHEQIARQWQQRLQQRLARLNLHVEAGSREEVEAQANDLINAEWEQWIAEYQDAQHAIDPFTVTLECPHPVGEAQDEQQEE